jgi:hypothetical protein
MTADGSFFGRRCATTISNASLGQGIVCWNLALAMETLLIRFDAEGASRSTFGKE